MNRDWLIAAFGLFLLAYPETTRKPASQSTNLSGLAAVSKKQKGNRLFYLWEEPGYEPKSRPRSDLSKLKKRALRGSGRLYAVYARSADDARREIKKGKAEIYSMFSGTHANCGIWDIAYSNKLRKYVWRCLMYAPACVGMECIEAPKLKGFGTTTGFSGALRTCVRFKRVDTILGKAKRCAEYQRICTTSACLPEPMPKPSGVMPNQPSKMETREFARYLAQEETARQMEAGPALAREIAQRGGIAPYKRGFLKEEYKEIPLHLKNKKGLPLDQMASEMGMDEQNLVRAIMKEYPKGRKKQRRFRWQDFEEEAYDILFKEQNPPLGQAIPSFVTRDPRAEEPGLFPVKRVLVLETEDVATSDDPLEIYLQRRGWDMMDVRDMQESISEKLVPDMFTGKTKPLSKAEKELQADIETFIQAQKAMREPAKVTARPVLYEPTQETMFYRTPAQTRMFGDMPNFHSARVWGKRSFKRLRTIHLSPGVSALVGPLKRAKTTGSRVQAYRFDRDFFTAAQAKNWLKEYNIKPILFEPARKLSALEGDLMNCAEWKKVYSKFYGKDVVRCARYAPTCDAPDCLDEPVKRKAEKKPAKKVAAKKIPPKKADTKAKAMKLSDQQIAKGIEFSRRKESPEGKVRRDEEGEWVLEIPGREQPRGLSTQIPILIENKVFAEKIEKGPTLGHHSRIFAERARETEKAIQYRIQNTIVDSRGKIRKTREEFIWLPKSAISEITPGMVVMDKWLMDKFGYSKPVYIRDIEEGKVIELKPIDFKKEYPYMVPGMKSRDSQQFFVYKTKAEAQKEIDEQKQAFFPKAKIKENPFTLAF